jgi:hypothetical protein
VVGRCDGDRGWQGLLKVIPLTRITRAAAAAMLILAGASLAAAV